MPKQTIAHQRILKLHQLAQTNIKTDPILARRYITLLKRIAQRTRTKLPQNIKLSICKKCNTPLIPGYNSTTRINQRREPHITTTCHNCGYTTRRPIGSK